MRFARNITSCPHCQLITEVWKWLNMAGYACKMHILSLQCIIRLIVKPGVI